MRASPGTYGKLCSTAVRGALSLVFNTLYLRTKTSIARIHPSAEKYEQTTWISPYTWCTRTLLWTHRDMKKRSHCLHRKLGVWERNRVLFYGKPIDQNYREQNRATIILAGMPSYTEVPQFTMQAISEHSE